MHEQTILFTETLISAANFAIILMGACFALVMLLRFKQRDSQAHLLLALSSLLFIGGKIFIISIINSGGTVESAQKFLLFQEYIVFAFMITLPYYMLKSFDHTEIDYKILHRATIAGAIVAPLLLIGALFFPDSFLVMPDPLSQTGYLNFFLAQPEHGILYLIRDGYLILLILVSVAIFIKKTLSGYAINDSIILICGGFAALYFGLMSIVQNYIDLPEMITLGRNHKAHFIIGLGLFHIAALLSSILHAIRKAKDSRQLTLALQQSEQELLRLAYHDAHTGILNRKSFYSQLDTSLEIARRTTKIEKRAILLLDLDNFKEINDSYGHPVGDELMRQMVKRFQNSIRKSDLLFRLVGDEFALIVYNVSSIENIALMAQKILMSLRNPFTVFDYSMYASTTIGIAIFPDDGEDSDTLLRHADYALYEAKKDRNTFKFYTSEMQRKAFERMSIINALRKSIREQEFELYYQGLHHQSGQLWGAEALIRWKNEGWNHIPTDFFIELAENSGLIIELGKWIIHQAFSQQKAITAGNPEIFLSINLSVKQLRDENFIDIIEKAEKTHRINPGRIVLELTESTFMDNPVKMGIKLRSLSARGYHLAIDDFGTGFSSFYYLKTMPLSILKIDKSFLIDLDKNSANKAMVRSIINMGHGMGMKITAEGVETPDQKDFLIKEGCDYLQGFYLDRPQPLPSFLNYFNLDSSLSS